MPLYDTLCRSCGTEEQDYYAPSSDVERFPSGDLGLRCSCGGEAIIQIRVGNIKLDGDNRMSGDIQGERLTPREFEKKYGETHVPLEPGTVRQRNMLELTRENNELRARRAGYNSQEDMFRKQKDQQRRTDERRSKAVPNA